MKRKLLSLVMALCMIVTLLPVTAFAAGEETWKADTSWYNDTSTEFTLDSADELAGLAKLVNEGNNFKGVTIYLGDDIDLASQEWTPIGKSGKPFSGTFDGQEYTISNLAIDQPTKSDMGLFGFTTGGQVKNFTLHNAKVTGYLDVGAVAGTPYTSEYSNIDVTGLIQVEGFSYVGGAFGKNAYANITDVDVTGGEGSYVKAYSIDSAGVWRTYLGGLVGFMGEGNITVSDCDVKIDVTGSTCDVGGILGILHYGNTLENCTYEGSLTLTDPEGESDNEFGALVGVINNGGSATTTTTITGCTASVVTATEGGKDVTDSITAHGGFYNDVTGSGNTGSVTVSATVNDKDVTVDNYVAKIGETGYKTLAAAIEAAKAATGTDPVTVTITKSGTYEPFTIDSNSHNGIVVQAAQGVDAVFEISASKKMTLNDGYTTQTPGISFKNITFVSLDGTTPLKSHYFGTEGHAFVVENCKFINKGEAAGTIAVYVDFPNVTIHDCEFTNWDAAFYTAGEGYAIDQMNVTDNTYHDVNAIVNGYWQQEPADGGCLTISGNTINPGKWGTSSIVLWDWAQYQAWLNDSTDSVTSAIKAVVKNNTVNGGELEYHKIHCDWFTASDITLPEDAKIVNHYLVQIDGTDVSAVAVYDADGQLVANMSTAGGKNYIYQMPEGEYTFKITQSQTGDSIVTEQQVAVTKPDDSKTQSVTVPALTSTSVAKVGEVEYTSLADAIDAANTGEDKTVTLLANISIDNWEQIWNLSGVTIDGDGHSIKINAIESLENHDAVIHSAGGNTFQDLTIDLSGITADSQAQGYRAFNATDGDSFTNVTVIGNEHVAYGIFASGTDETDDTITITDCTFQDCAYAIGSEPVAGTTTSVLENLTVTGSTFTGCEYAGILYTPNVTFTGNTVSGGRLNIMHETQNISENTFEDGSRIKFYADPETFQKNKISADSCLDADADVTSIDVSENYWGGEAPSAEQLNGVNVTGSDVYYVRDTMNPEDLNTYVSSSGSTSYAITVEKADNGTVTASRTRASKGLTITLTVKADEGYELDTLTVTDKNGNEIKLTDKGDGKYTFTMPSSAVTVKASFAKDDTPVETGLPFTDVKADDWFFEAVKYVYDNKLMDGTSSTTFAPLMTTNRAMIVTILWRLEGQPETDATLSFTDVESGVWYTDAVNWAASKGIVKGYSDTVFAPNDTVTREQLATILYRYAETKGYDVTAEGDLSTFADGANTSSWAAEAMEWAVGSGLLSGKDGGKLDPTGTATRAEVATILMRFVESVSK